MVLALVGARKIMDYIFTQRELEYLDDVMPEVVKKEIEARKNSGIEENKQDGNTVCHDQLLKIFRQLNRRFFFKKKREFE
jgi:hypothetical protein